MKPPGPPRRPRTDPKAPSSASPKPATPKPAVSKPAGQPPRVSQAPAKVAQPAPSGAVATAAEREGLAKKWQQDQPSQLQERQQEKKRARRHLRLVNLVRVAAFAALVGLIVWVVGFSPLLAVRADHVEVSAQSGEVNTAPVEARVSQEVGTPLARVNTRQLQSDILSDPSISTAQVHRVWPNGLSVGLTPRQPVMAVHVGSAYQRMGPDGVVIDEVAEPPAGLILVEAGGKALGETQVDLVLALWQVLPEAIRARVVGIELAGTNFTLTLDGGAKVIWGDSSQAELKGQVLGLLLGQREAGVYDVSTPDRPSIK